MPEKGFCGTECCFGYSMVDGSCKTCPAGTFGRRCAQTCPRLYYGTHCNTMCNCSEEECNPVKGCAGHIETSTLPSSSDDTVTYILGLPTSHVIIIAAVFVCLTVILIVAVVIFKRKRSIGGSAEGKRTYEGRVTRQHYNKRGGVMKSNRPRSEEENIYIYDSIRESKMITGNITDGNKLVSFKM